MARVLAGGGGGGGGGPVMTALVPRGPGGAHPAGIFSDLSVDGPVIGTLVVILDRGKNLPNRKTLGKQDPYCVARLGKEAKRTEPDKRGGQTPKWDKELRFEVRDSPDYRILKLTCFNDDKKTDLIGECIIRLDKILISGGGQDDGWRQLHCKGKYAGEVRVEITFYDLREKKIDSKRGKGSDEKGDYDEDEDAYDDTQEEQEVVSGPRALAGMGQLSVAKRERDKERRRQKEADFKKERERERMKREPLRRALPSEPSIPPVEPSAADAKKKDQKLRDREKEREKERQLREREKRTAQRSSRHQDDYEREKERELRERQRERERRLDERERRKRRDVYPGEYERDRDEYAEGRRSRHARAMSNSPIPPPPARYSRGDRGASPIPPHRGGASPIPPHRGGASPIPPHRGGASPIPPHRGGASPIPPHRGGASPIPPHRGGASPIPPHRGNNDHRGHSPIPPRRDDRGGASPIPPQRRDRGGHSPIPPNRRHTMYEYDEYGREQFTDFEDMDDGYGGQLQLTHQNSQSHPSHQGGHPVLPPLQTQQPLYNNPNSSSAQLYSNPNGSSAQLYSNPNGSSAQLYSNPNSSSAQLYAQANGSFVDLPSPDGPPPPPPPHRHIQPQASNSQLRHQPSVMMQQNQHPPQPPKQLLLTHQSSHAPLQHKPSQMQLATVQKQPTRKLKHQPSVADWAATQEIEIDPHKIPGGIQSGAVIPKVGQLKQRPRAPSSTYTSAPDFEALSKPDAPINDEFDDSGRFAPNAPPPKPMPRVAPKPDLSGDSNAGALVPAGFNYASTDPPGYWKPPFANRPRSGSDSTAMVITSQKQRPPPPQYSSAANSRRNSFIGDNLLPPSLIPGIDPSLAELIAEAEREKDMAIAVRQQEQQVGLVGAHQPQQLHPHAPPAPYIEEVNDREDGGRRRSANGAAGLQLAAAGGKGPGAAQVPQLASTAEGQAQQLNEVAPLASAGDNASSGRALEPIVPPPQPPSRAKTKRLDGIPFNPDAYNIINPKPSKMPPPTRGGTVIRPSNNSSSTNSNNNSTTTISAVSSATSSNPRNLDEILPPETFAPEPEPKPKSVAQLQAEAEQEMQVQLRKARGITGVRDMQSFPPPPAYPAPKLPIAIPERGSSSRIGAKKPLALPPNEGAPPPPPPGHQTLAIVPGNSSSSSATKSGTVRNKLQKSRHQQHKSIDTSARRSITAGNGGEITQYSQAQSLNMQIAQHEARLAREAEHAAQRRALAEAKTREEKTRRERDRDVYNSNRHSIAGPPSQPPPSYPPGGLTGYNNSYARHSMAALPGPPGYNDGMSGGEEGAEGAMVLHRHRSAEPVWDQGTGRRSYDASAGASGYNLSRVPSHNNLSRVPSQNNLSRVPSHSNLNNDGYDQGMVLYRPGGSSASSGVSSSGGGYAGYASGGGGGNGGGGYASGYGSNISNSGSGTSYSGRARGGSEPPPRMPQQHQHAPRNQVEGNSPGGYGGGGYAGGAGSGGYDESMALMSHEEYLLSQELKGISIGVGSGGGGRTGGTIARRSRGY